MPVPTRAAPSARAALGPPLWTAWNQRGGDSPGSADGARERGGVARSSRTLRTELGEFSFVRSRQARKTSFPVNLLTRAADSMSNGR